MPRPLVAPNLSALPGIAHGFFTRHGGVSQGIYASLNCGPGSRDDPAAVAENRSRVQAHLGAGSLISLHQIHSRIAVVATGPWPGGERPRADAVVTAIPGIAVSALAADCAPVLFADAEARVVAAAHAGWRGALDGVLEATIEAMESLGARRHRIAAAVGPCIGPEAYEVGDEFKAEFLRRDPESTPYFSAPQYGARPHFSLPGYVAGRLHRAGIAAGKEDMPCTFQQTGELFSYRRSQRAGEPDYGRQISAIVLT